MNSTSTDSNRQREEERRTQRATTRTTHNSERGTTRWCVFVCWVGCRVDGGRNGAWKTDATKRTNQKTRENKANFEAMVEEENKRKSREKREKYIENGPDYVGR